MSVSALALCGLVLWSVVLTFLLVGVRVSSALGGDKALNGFQPDGKDLSDFGLRATRSHANSLEYLALPAALILLAIATGNSAITDGLAMVYLIARVVQSVIHLISTSVPMVMLRATAFTVQNVILVIWGFKLYGAG